MVIYDLPILVKQKNFYKVKIKKIFLKRIGPIYHLKAVYHLEEKYSKKIMKKISFKYFPDIWMDFRIAIYLMYIEKKFSF